eukprot:scaffold123120_cov19-Prasinocladus_malaysianus.AAC.1
MHSVLISSFTTGCGVDVLIYKLFSAMFILRGKDATELNNLLEGADLYVTHIRCLRQNGVCVLPI